MTGMLHPDGCLIVGVEDEPGGSMRVYLNARWTGVHTHVDDPVAQDEIRGAWGSNRHVLTIVPRAAQCDCGPETATIRDHDRTVSS